MQALRAAQADSHADIALGVSVYPEERAAEMAMISSNRRKDPSHHLWRTSAQPAALGNEPGFELAAHDR